MIQHTPAFHDSLDLKLLSRRPARLSAETTRAVLARSIPETEPPIGYPSDEPTSIVVVTYDNLVFSRLCLESVLMHTLDAPYELIVVDNGSTDGSPEYLRRLSRRNPQVRVIFNAENRGFAAATNQGLERAGGTRLVLLNNDTIVSPSWLARLIAPLDDAGIGMISPVTNRCGNEAEIVGRYRTFGEFLRFAENRLRVCRGEVSDITSLVMFCAAMRHDVWAEIGPLDERFEVGMFEDDDYATRLHSSGYRIACVEDTFIHHFGQATIGKLSEAGEYGRRFHTNRRRWEAKWGRQWTPHSRRPNPEYAELVRRVREATRPFDFTDGAVAVVSGGDDALLDLGPCESLHFPCDDDGQHAGFHPRDSRDAITRLAAIRARGARYLIVPSTAYWWLDYYSDFLRHLEEKHQRLAHDPDSCAVFALTPVDAATALREEHHVA